MTKKHSRSIADAINAFLKEDDWHYSFNEERDSFKFGLSLSGKLRTVNYYILVHEGDYVVYTVSPIKADPEDDGMMQRMAEFVCRANYGLNCGNFELDYSDGEIRYKCYVSCEGGAVPTSEIIRESIYCPARMFERYAPGIIGIVIQDREARDMVMECENAKEGIRELIGRLGEEEGEVSAAVARAAGFLGIPMDENASSSDRTDPNEDAMAEDAMDALVDLLNDIVDEDVEEGEY